MLSKLPATKNGWLSIKNVGRKGKGRDKRRGKPATTREKGEPGAISMKCMHTEGRSGRCLTPYAQPNSPTCSPHHHGSRPQSTMPFITTLSTWAGGGGRPAHNRRQLRATPPSMHHCALHHCSCFAQPILLSKSKLSQTVCTPKNRAPKHFIKTARPRLRPPFRG